MDVFSWDVCGKYICKAFNLNGGYIAGMILLPGIFLLVIGFGKSEYVGKYVAHN